MIISKEILYGTAASWNLFSGRKFTAGDADPAAGYIIVPGILIGIAAAIPAWSGTILFGKIAAGIAAAIILTLLHELLTDWNGLRNTTAFLSFRLEGTSNLPGGSGEKKITPFFIFTSLYLLRALAIGSTAAFAPGLFILIFTASWLIRFELAAFSDETHEALLEPAPAERVFTYRLTALVFILEPILSFHPINFARSFLIALVMFLICVFQKRKIGSSPEKLSIRRISIYSFTAELLLLYTALAVL